MRNKRIMVPVLVAVFLLAGAGTVFAMTKIKQSTPEEPQQTEETTAVEEETKETTTTEETTEGEKKEETQTPATIEEQNQKAVEKQRACNLLREQMNAEIRKEDQEYGVALQKPNGCVGSQCSDAAATVEQNHKKKVSDIIDNYQKKWTYYSCPGVL